MRGGAEKCLGRKDEIPDLPGGMYIVGRPAGAVWHGRNITEEIYYCEVAPRGYYAVLPARLPGSGRPAARAGGSNDGRDRNLDRILYTPVPSCSARPIPDRGAGFSPAALRHAPRAGARKLPARDRYIWTLEY